MVPIMVIHAATSTTTTSATNSRRIASAFHEVYDRKINLMMLQRELRVLEKEGVVVLIQEGIDFAVRFTTTLSNDSLTRVPVHSVLIWGNGNPRTINSSSVGKQSQVVGEPITLRKAKPMIR